MLHVTRNRTLTRRLMCALVALALAIGMSGGSSAQETRFGSTDARRLNPLLRTLESANLSGSLEISGFCDDGSFPHFPHLGKKTGLPPLRELSEMFSSSPVRVTQDSGGNVRMIEPGVPDDFLSVRIHRVTFKDYQGNGIFDGYDALSLVLGAPEVVAFVRRHDIELVRSVTMFSGGLPPYSPSFPHMSGTLDNVTVGEALDRIQRTFHDIWVYENCARSETHKRAVYLEFFRVQRWH
jgi:hypothetical protein